MFQVEWLQVAADELARFWLQADARLRQELSRASNQIDKVLSLNPNDEGESRSGGNRILFVRPLAVTFQVDNDNRIVTVAGIRLSLPRRK